MQRDLQAPVVNQLSTTRLLVYPSQEQTILTTQDPSLRLSFKCKSMGTLKLLPCSLIPLQYDTTPDDCNRLKIVVIEEAPCVKFDENFMMTWTGKDPMAVRALFKEQVTMKTQAKLIYLSAIIPDCHEENEDRRHIFR
jgi:hypothetical protein